MIDKRPKTPRRKYITTKEGWTLNDIATNGKFDNPGSIRTWSIITELNGFDNWIVFNKQLRAGQKVRIK